MFNFLKRKNKPEPQPEPELEPELIHPEKIAELNFSVDMLGDIWVECKWDTESHSNAHIFFADMLNRVSSGDTLDDALMFIREAAEEEGRLAEYQAILDYMLKAHEQKMSLMFGDMVTNMTGANTQKEDSLVVNPTDMLNKGHPHDQ